MLNSYTEKVSIPSALGLSVDSETVLSVNDYVSGFEFSIKPEKVKIASHLGADVVILNPGLLGVNVLIWLDVTTSRVGFKVA